MIFWIKKFARILSILTFFVVFFIGLNSPDPFDPMIISIALVKAIIGAILFWFIGIIVADIVLKGIVAETDTVPEDAIDGGLIQRIYEEKEKQNPDIQMSSAKSQSK